MKKLFLFMMTVILSLGMIAAPVGAENESQSSTTSCILEYSKYDGENPVYNNFRITCDSEVFTNARQVKLTLTPISEFSGVKTTLVLSKYALTSTTLEMTADNMSAIASTVQTGDYSVSMTVMTSVQGGTGPSWSDPIPVSDSFHFIKNHKDVPASASVSVNEQGLVIGCNPIQDSECDSWLRTLSRDENHYSFVQLSPEWHMFPDMNNGLTNYEEIFVLQTSSANEHLLESVTILKEEIINRGLKESVFDITVSVNGYATYVASQTNVPFRPLTVDESSIQVIETLDEEDDPILLITSEVSDDLRAWMEAVNTLVFKNTNTGIGFESEVQTINNQLVLKCPFNKYGAFTPGTATMEIRAKGYSPVTIENVTIKNGFIQTSPEFNVFVKSSGMEIEAGGEEGLKWLTALTKYKVEEDARPYVTIYASVNGLETFIRVMNTSKDDTALNIANLTSDNGVHTLLIPMDDIIEAGEIKTGNYVVSVRPVPFGYASRIFEDNVALYPMLKLVSETQNAVKNDTDIDTEVLDELDEYLTGNQITNVTVMVNNDDLRKNGSSKVELKGELTAMIVSDAEGNYTVNDLNHDSVSMNMSTTIDDVNLTEAQIEEYVETLMATANEMQTVYDNFGFDIKLHKENKEMKDLAVATAITLGLPEAIEVNDGDTLVLLTVHNGTAKYLPVVVMTDENGNRTGLAYTSEFSSFIPVVIKANSTVEAETKIEIEELTTIPAELISEYDTVEKLKEEMIAVLNEKSAISKENAAVYDVVLMATFDGVNYVEADETHWPADGKIHVVLPYPSGTDKTYSFTVAHMFTKNLFGKTAGDIEYPAVTLTENGIEFDVTGLSPISLGWKKKVEPTPTPTPIPIPTPTPTPIPTPDSGTTVEPEPTSAPSVPNTSDNSNMLLYSYTAMASLLAAIALTLMKKRQLTK